MRILFKNPPLCTIYLCERGGIHIVTHNVNVGMPLEKFHELNTELQKALIRFELGQWPSPYIAVTYNTTVICLNIDDLPEFSQAMASTADLLREVSEFGFMPAADHKQCSVDLPTVSALPIKNSQNTEKNFLPLNPN